MKKIIPIVIVLFIVSCSYSYTPPSINPDIKFKEITYGICETTRTEKVKSSKSPTGYQSYETGFKIIKKTNKIPTKLNVKFGIKYKFKSKKSQQIKVEKVWIFPQEMTDGNGKKFKELRRFMNVYTNEVTFTTYKLEEEYEMVKGEWRLQFHYNGKQLYEKVFIVE